MWSVTVTDPGPVPALCTEIVYGIVWPGCTKWPLPGTSVFTTEKTASGFETDDEQPVVTQGVVLENDTVLTTVDPADVATLASKLTTATPEAASVEAWIRIVRPVRVAVQPGVDLQASVVADASVEGSTSVSTALPVAVPTLVTVIAYLMTEPGSTLTPLPGTSVFSTLKSGLPVAVSRQ